MVNGRDLLLGNKCRQQIPICNYCVSCPYGLTHSKIKKCTCGLPCACLGIPQIPVDEGFAIWPVLSGEDKIQIVYRRQIKVHYGT
jgi:hypothetical protein